MRLAIFAGLALAGILGAQNLRFHTYPSGLIEQRSTDSESFAPTKIPRITISSITQSTLEILHTPKDTLDVIRLADYYDRYKLLVLYLALLDVKLGAS